MATMQRTCRPSGLAGFGITKRDEVGVWFAASAQGDEGTMGGTPVELTPISQVNAYLRHTWPRAAWTSVWAGVAEGHDNVVWLLPPDSRHENVFVYGAELHLPLSDRFAITGAANFLTPTSTGTVDANNATFPVDLTR